MIGFDLKSRTRGALAVAIAAAVTCASAQAASPVDGVVLDWPIGDLVGGVFVGGKNVYVMQDYENPNPNYSNRLHAGMDLIRDAGATATVGWNVRAAAAGKVVCRIDSGYPGGVIVVEHTGNTGVKFYTQYGHITPSVAVNTNVARGQVLGTIISWPGNAANSHVHFEVRNARDMLGSCWGPGYASAGYNPNQQGWFDPANQVYNRRPPFPRIVATDMQMNVRSGPGTGYSIIGSLAANAQVTGYDVVPSGTGWWYRINYAGNTNAYVAAFLNAGWGAEVYSSDK